MKETEVGKFTIEEEVTLAFSVVDWGQKHNVCLRIGIDGPGFGFHVDLAPELQDFGEMFEAARLVRLGVIADRYDKPRKAASPTAAKILEDVTADMAAAFPENTIFSFRNGDDVRTAEEFVAVMGGEQITIPVGTHGSVVGANDTMLIVKMEEGPPPVFGEEPRTSMAVLWVDPKHLELMPQPVPERLPEAAPAVLAPVVGDVVLSSENVERGVLIGTKGTVAEVSEAGLLTIDWETPMGTRRRQDVDPSTVSVARPVVAPIRARTEDDEF